MARASKFGIPDGQFLLNQEKEELEAKAEKEAEVSVKESKEVPSVSLSSVPINVQTANDELVNEDRSEDEAQKPKYISKKPKLGERMTLIITDENCEYIRRESKCRGLGLGEFVNRIFDEYRRVPGNKNYIDV